MGKPKLCYILPLYENDTDSHFFYLYDFIEKLAIKHDIYLIVERSRGSIPIKGCSHFYVQRMHFLIFRLIELKAVVWWARLSGYKTFYVHYSYLGALVAGMMSRFTGARTFYWNCGMPWLFGRQLILRLVLKVVNYLVTGSDSLANQYSQKLGINRKKIRVMPNWLDYEPFPSGPSNKLSIRQQLNLPTVKKVILFVHWLSERKGADLLIPICEQLMMNDAVFVVIGRGPLLEKIKSDVKQRGLESRFLVLGAVAQRDIKKYFQASDMFLMPSREEGFPHVMLEAMASALPFVVSNVGAVEQIIPEEAKKYMVNSNQPIDYAQKIKLLLSNEVDYTQISSQSLNKVRQYGQKQALKIFDNIISNDE